mmetsp:Transcript_69448/g.166487  ORF Transcript_69448/g.166487 Transcript_69448/m.166487 type:complete len:90 (-) Transcript_69448:12-281(-)
MLTPALLALPDDNCRGRLPSPPTAAALGKDSQLILGARGTQGPDSACGVTLLCSIPLLPGAAPSCIEDILLYFAFYVTRKKASTTISSR